MWFLFFVFLVLTVCAANYQKKTPVILPGEKTTTLKPGLIALLGVITFFLLLAAMASSEKDSSKEASPAGGTTRHEKPPQGGSPSYQGGVLGGFQGHN